MKYKLELLINKPRSDVWKFFTDPEKTKLWQPSLQSIEMISGAAGQPDAVSTWTYQEGERKFSLTEKVVQSKAPDHFESLFENAFATNTVNHTFTAQSENETLWTLETAYTFKTLLMKILGPFLKKNYIARSQKEMDRFKEAIESS
jgi:uncharacterized protein YndB with AHSA1/START domain